MKKRFINIWNLMKNPKSEKIIFSIYIGLFVVLAVTLALHQPLTNTPPLYGNPPDEHSRFKVPLFICRYGVLPTGFEEEVRIPGYGFSYALYNVLPYIVQGWVMRAVSLFTGAELHLLYAARLVNVATGVCMAGVVYLLSAKLFSDRRFRWLLCFGIMFLPQNLFIHSYVNTDSACLLSVSMMLYGLVSGYREGFSTKNCLWLSGGIILCALSYYNAYGYILSSIVLFAGSFLKKKDGKWSCEWKEMIKKGGFISILVLLGIGWWFIRSYRLYDGDLLGLQTRDRMAIEYADEGLNPLIMNTYEKQGVGVWTMMRERGFLPIAFTSFIASFGSMSIYGPLTMYRLYKIVLGTGIASVILLREKKSGKEGSAGEKRGRISLRELFFHCNMVFCILMPFFLLIQYAYTMDYQSQGRYLLPSLIPLMYYVIRGLQKLAGRRWVPGWLANTGVACALLLPVCSSLYMVYFRALPVYLTTGVVLH